MSKLEYVDLARSFRVPQEAEDGDTPPFGWRHSYSSVGWEDLLRAEAVVLLGEPGAGKTTELRAQARRMAKSGDAALFVEAAELDGRLSEVLGTEAESQFMEALDSGARAHVFLDSVDEGQSAGVELRGVLRRIQSWFEERRFELPRLVVSCRAAEWHSARYDNVLRGWLRSTRLVAEVDSPAVRTVALAPLDWQQVERLLTAWEFPSPKGLLDAIRDQGADSLVLTPRDVEWLNTVWVDDEGLPSRAELLDRFVDSNLAEVRLGSDISDALPLETLRGGAARLAVVCTLSGSVALHDGTDFGRRGTSLVDALPGWSRAAHRGLLARALFRVSEHGTFRFQSRDVAEFLCGERLRHLRSLGATMESVAGLLFVEANGLKAREGCESVAMQWASEHSCVLTHLAKTDPLNVLEYASPPSSPGVLFMQALRALGRQYEGRDYLPSDLSEPRMRLLAEHLDGAWLVAELRRARTRDLRVLLLGVLEQQGGSGSVTVAEGILMDERENSIVRAAAAYCLAASDDLEACARAVELVTSSEVPGRVATALVRALFPMLLGVPVILDLVDSWRKDRIAEVEELLWAIRGELHSLGVDEAIELAMGVCSRCDEGLWTGRARSREARLVVDVLSQLDDEVVFEASTLERLQTALDGIQFSGLDGVAERAKFPQALRRAMCIRFLRESTLLAYQLTLAGLTPLRLQYPSDFWWLRSSVEQMKSAEERAQGARICAALLRLNDAPDSEWEALTTILGPEEGAVVECERRGPSHPVTERPKVGNTVDPWAPLRVELSAELSELRAGQRPDLVYETHVRLQGEPAELKPFNHDAAVRNLGEETAHALRAGLRRRFEVGLKELSGRAEWVVLEASECLEPARAPHLTAEQARWILQCAAVAPNRLPEWASLLIQNHPEVVSGWRTELEQSLRSAENLPVLLAKLLCSWEQVPRVVGDLVFACLESTAVANGEGLVLAARVLAATSQDHRDQLVSLIGPRVQRVSQIDSTLAETMWLWIGICLGSSAAVDRFSVLVSVAGYQSLSSLADAAERAPELLDGGYASAELVATVLGAVQARRFALSEAGSGPQRDQLSWFTHRLNEHLEARGDKEVATEFERLADDPAVGPSRDFYFLKSQEAELRLATQGITESMVLSLEDRVIAPRSVEELFALVRELCQRINEDMENGDFSYKAAFSAGKHDESVLQAWLAAQLDLHSRGRFSVSREPEVIDKKRPDIRISTDAGDRVVVEVKWANKWTYNELADAIEKQLVDRYLRDFRSRYGVLFLGLGRTKKFGRKRVAFKDLPGDLSRIAAAVADRRRADVERLWVTGVSFV